MKKLRNFFLYMLVFFVALMFFTPKVQLYFTLEKVLKKYDVIIANETLKDNGFYLDVFKSDIYVQGIKSAHIQDLEVGLFGVYNTLSIHNVKLSETFIKMVPIEIESAKVYYSVLNPLKVYMNASGEFGTLEGAVDLVDRVVHVDLNASKLMKRNYARSLKQFKPSETGGLIYESHF